MSATKSEVLLTDRGWRLVEQSTDGIEKWVYVEQQIDGEIRRIKGMWTGRTYVLWGGAINSAPSFGLGLFPGNCKAVLENPEIPKSIKNVVEAYMLMDI